MKNLSLTAKVKLNSFYDFLVNKDLTKEEFFKDDYERFSDLMALMEEYPYSLDVYTISILYVIRMKEISIKAENGAFLESPSYDEEEDFSICKNCQKLKLLLNEEDNLDESEKTESLKTKQEAIEIINSYFYLYLEESFDIIFSTLNKSFLWIFLDWRFTRDGILQRVIAKDINCFKKYSLLKPDFDKNLVFIIKKAMRKRQEIIIKERKEWTKWGESKINSLIRFCISKLLKNDNPYNIIIKLIFLI